MLKRIAIIIERADVSLGGAERSVSELANAIRNAGLDVDILAAKGIAQNNVFPLCNEYRSKRVGFDKFAEALRKHIAENKYDIIHSTLPFEFSDIYQPRGGSYAESIIRNAVSYQSKLLETVKKTTAFVNLRRTRLLYAEERLCKNPKGPAIAALSQYVADQFKNHYHLDEKRIHVISNGVKMVKTNLAEENKKIKYDVLKKLSFKEADNPILFLFAANNFRLKGLYPLIESLKIVINRQPAKEIGLIVLGNGKKAKYQSLAKKLGIEKNILFAGAVSNTQNYLNICDTAILPTFYDPASRFILEALTIHKPAITTEFNGAIDLFENKRHGIVIDSPENIEELSNAIRYFTEDKNRQQAETAIINDRLVEKISIERVASEMIELYEKILIQKRRTK